MNKIDMYLSIGGHILEVVCAMALVLYQKHKGKIQFNASQSLQSFIRDMVKLAEECKGYTGEEKKKFVWTRIKEYLLEKSNAYIRKYIKDEVIDKMIEDEVALTNAVNVDKKNKGVA